MEYTQTDPTAAVDSLMAERAAEHKWQQFCHQLDADSLAWCADIATVTESGDLGKEATAQAEKANEAVKDTGAVAEKFASKIDNPKMAEQIDKALGEKKAEWLPQYIAQVEAEYAQHEALAKLADEEGNTEQADAHRLAMLRCEAAQQTALERLGALIAAKVDDVTAADVADVLGVDVARIEAATKP